MQNHYCNECGTADIFLRKKNHQIGLYCLYCGKWHKWVSKKDVKAYKHRGFKVHEESYVPKEIEAPPTKPNLNKDFDLQADDIGDLGRTTYQQPEIEENYRNTPPDFIDPDRYDDFTDDIEEETSHPHTDPCPVCVSGTMDSMVKTDKVKITIFDDVLSVWSKDNTILHGSFKIKHCPNCGKRIN